MNNPEIDIDENLVKLSIQNLILIKMNLIFFLE